MKRITLLLTLSLLGAVVANATSPDTIIVYKDKKIELIDRDAKGRMNIRVTSPKSLDSPAIIYEGRFAEESEQGSFYPIPDILALGLRIHRPMKAHYSMVGLGYSMLADDELGLDHYPSTEVIFNFAEVIFPIYKNYVGLTTGLGVNWKTFYIGANNGLVMHSDRTELIPNPEGRHYEYSRLKTVHLTVPLLIEVQPFRRKHFYVAAGVEGGLKIFTAYKERFTENNLKQTALDTKRKYHTYPLSFNFLGQVGVGVVGLYAKYSPIGLFVDDKGPDGQPFSIGVNINL